MTTDYMAATHDLTLSEAQLREVTGYRQPYKQLAELQRRGFHRARLSKVTGKVILERAHYDAVCAGAVPVSAPPRLRPSLRAVG